MEFAKRIKELRTDRNLSQSQFGEILGMAGSMICGFENNSHFPSVSNLLKIADRLDVSTDWLLGWTPGQKSKNHIKTNLSKAKIDVSEHGLLGKIIKRPSKCPEKIAEDKVKNKPGRPKKELVPVKKKPGRPKKIV